jgi:hypothetical protein
VVFSSKTNAWNSPESTLERDLYAALRVYQIEIEVDLRSTALSQTVLEGSFIGRIIPPGERREIRLALVICDLRHDFASAFWLAELFKSGVNAMTKNPIRNVLNAAAVSQTTDLSKVASAHSNSAEASEVGIPF